MKTVSIGTRVGEDVQAALNDAAKGLDRDVAWIVRQALTEYLDRPEVRTAIAKARGDMAPISPGAEAANKLVDAARDTVLGIGATLARGRRIVAAVMALDRLPSTGITNERLQAAAERIAANPQAGIPSVVPGTRQIIDDNLRITYDIADDGSIRILSADEA